MSITTLTAALADRYRIEREIGQGGMATVYLARDIRNDRDVAIKVLKPELGAVLGVERFLSEIKVTANLQHPNLLPLFDSGEAAGFLFYVMPYVDGETLRARLEREKQLPVAEAVRLSVAIAQALDYAHRRGVIHRDLKPENILLPDGQPLVADFGIALAVSNSGGQRVTQTGLSLGTPQYMSPEQATGDRTVDARTDIYSLAAMTYEMLTGEPPHSGTTAQAIIARLMTEDVRPITVLRRTVPPHVDAAVRHALEKLAADRFATAGEFALALQGKGDLDPLVRYQNLPGVDAPSGVRRRRWREAAAWSVAGLALAALWRVSTQASPLAIAPVVRHVIDTPVGDRLMVGGFPIVISAQGDQFAYVTQGSAGYRTVVRRASEIGGEITLANESLMDVVFSPDGRWLAYQKDNKIFRIASEGGTSTLLGSSSGGVRGLAWTPNDTILIGTSTGLLALSAQGGTARRVTDSTFTERAVLPVLLANGKTAVVSTSELQASGRLIAITLATGATTDIGVVAERALGVQHGHLLYYTANADLIAVPFDEKTLRVTGNPVPIERDVTGVGLSASGTLAFNPRTRALRIALAGNGADEILRAESANYNSPRFSPDGRRVAVSIAREDAADIWILDRVAGTFTRITTSGINSAPEWTPDGRRVLYRSVLNGKTSVQWAPIDGSAKAEKLFEGPATINEAVISPDSRWLVLRTAPGGRYPRDILALELGGDGTLLPIVTGPASEQMPRISPDGRWMAYQSDESGRVEIIVRPFPGDGARVQVSTDGGTEPLWDRSGRTLFYRARDGIMAADVTFGAEFAVVARRMALPGIEPPDPTHPAYDVSPDGKRFLVLRSADGDAQAIIVHNWAREFAERLRGMRP